MPYYIRKKSANTWTHGTTNIIISQGYFRIQVTNEGEIFELTELAGSDNVKTLVSEIRVVDETNGNAETSYATGTLLSDGLKSLGYPFFKSASGGSGAGIVERVVGGTDISVDDTDSANPIVNYTGSGGGNQNIQETLVNGNTTNEDLIFGDGTDGFRLFLIEGLGGGLQIDSPSGFLINKPSNTSSFINNYLFSDLGVGIKTGNQNAYGFLKSDNILSFQTYQLPNESGTFPLEFTDGTNTVTANTNGLVDISSISGSGSGGTDDQTASEVPILDTSNNFTATEVESALAELKTQIDNASGVGISTSQAQGLVDAELIRGVNYFDASRGVQLGVNSNSSSNDPTVSFYQGTGLVPVNQNEIIYVILPDFNKVVANFQRVPVSIFDANGDWLETIDYSLNKNNSLVEIEITNPSATHIVASVVSGTFSSPISTDGYYLFRQSELNDATRSFINEINATANKIVISETQIDNIDSIIGGTLSGNTVTATSSTQVYITDKTTNTLMLNSVDYTIAYKVDVELISAANTLLEVSYFSNESRKWNLKQNEKITIFGIETSGQGSLRIGNAATVEFSNIKKVVLNNIALNTLLPNAISDALDEGEITNTVDVALKAVSMPISATYNKVVWFGDSTTQGTYGGYVPLVMQKIGAPFLNLAVDGSYPNDKNSDQNDTSWNLRDAQLALIPDDAGVVVFSGGVNNSNALVGTDVNTLDRSTAIGALNFAIDYVRTNHPYARIILETPPPSRNPDLTANPITNWITAYRDVAANRNVMLADVAKEAGFNDSTLSFCMYDSNHFTLEGNYRRAAVHVATIRKIMY